MFMLLRMLQKLVQALNSDGTPGQVAAGIALGAVFGLTPLLNLHNLVFFGLAMVLKVSFPGVILGWLLFVPVGFLLDPVFDAVGTRLLADTPVLTQLWTAWYDTPVLALTNFNNTVVLGSLVVWAVLYLPMFFLFRWLVGRYRATIYERLKSTRWFRAVRASRVYNLYVLLRP